MATATAKRKQTLTNEQILAAVPSDEIVLHNWLRSDPVAFCRHALKFNPHKKQIEVLRAPLERCKSILPWLRQAGKSTIMANFLTHRLFACRNYSAFLFAPSGEQSRLLFDKIVHNYETSDYLRRYTDFKVKGHVLSVGGHAWNSKVEWIKTGLTAENARGRSTSGNGIVVFDEIASFLYPQEIVGVIEPFIASGGGEVFLSSPGEVGSFMHGVYLDFKEQEALALADGRTPRHRVYECEWSDTDHISAEFVAEQERILTKQGRRWFFEREYLGKWTKSEGQFFNSADVKSCQSPTTLTGGSADCWIYSLDPGLDRSPAVLLIARWSPLHRRLEICECLSLVRASNRYVRDGDGHETIDGYPDLLELILERRRERPIHRFYADPGTEKNIPETLKNRFAVNVVECRIGGYAAKLTALQDLQRALSEKRIVWEDGRITRQLLDFAPPKDAVTGRYDFPDSNYDIIAALTQLCRYLGDRVETPFLFDAGGVRTAW